MAQNDIKLPIFTSESEDTSQGKGLLGEGGDGRNATSVVEPKKMWPGQSLLASRDRFPAFQGPCTDCPPACRLHHHGLDRPQLVGHPPERLHSVSPTHESRRAWPAGTDRRPLVPSRELKFN